MARSISKGSFIVGHLMNKSTSLYAENSNKKKAIKTWSRRSNTFPQVVGLTFAVHNGREFAITVSDFGAG